MKPGDLWLHLEAYLALKKALGFPLGVRERVLRDFVAFAEINGIRGTINAQVAFDWACSVSDRCGISGRAARLSVARQFLSHLSAVVTLGGQMASRCERAFQSGYAPSILLNLTR